MGTFKLVSLNWQEVDNAHFVADGQDELWGK